MKKWQKLKRKEDAKRLNHRGRKRPKETERTLPIIQQSLPPQTTIPDTLKPQGDTGNKKRFSWKIFSSIAVIVLGFFGFEALWPKVIIDSSQASDRGFLLNQFRFENQPVFPIKIRSIMVSCLDVSQGHKKLEFKGMSFYGDFDNISIPGKDSITIRIDSIFDTAEYGAIDEGSKILVRLTYQIPFTGIKKIDWAFFEAGKDNAGGLVWIKKPIPANAYWNDKSIIKFHPQIIGF